MSRRDATVVYILANLLITALVVVPMVLTGAPAWACIGVGWLAYLIGVTQELVKR